MGTSPKKLRISIFEKLRRRRVARRIAAGDLPRGRTVTKPKKGVRTEMKEPDNIVTLEARLSAKVFRVDGLIEDLGVIARKKVTAAFVNYLVDSLQDSTTYPMDVFKYHDSGTGVGAESNADTVLGTACGEARDTGTQVEGASANIFKTVATHTYAGAFAITEHGLFSAAANGTLMDRSVFAAINVTASDSIQFTYELTASAET